ncbi:MAG: 50S ribosomal protein L29 [Sphingobacteriia bacterium]|jgi:large subunit ribosomal protein L29|nr:50S ribosomal protein L29 [Sphingobacteriia bacterium]HML83583.1 50S ribosomal protein L29 [Bacteroidales bacterium]
MKQEVITELSTNDLLEKLEEQTLQLNRMKLNHAVSPLENPQMIKTNRKVIARINTELRRRELENK